MSMTFADLGLPREITSPLAKAGIRSPFPIQAASIPDALAGRDVCGRAPTGSGKTLAFGLPILATVAKAAPHRPKALILSPTRELAEQIRRELAPVAAGRGLRLLTVYGGVPYHPQRAKLRRGVDVLIACPGRLIDLLEAGDVHLDAVTQVVVDEADRMADMGFLPQVRRLLDETPRGRQTVMFSATLDGDVAVLTQRYQRNPVRHEVGAEGQDSGTARHHFWRVEHAARLGHVVDVVSSFGSTLVFTRTRQGADRLAQLLIRRGVRAAAIHGGRSQRQRDRALRDFTRGTVEALVATDVAARGIHVDGVDCVVHYDPPDDHKAYLHRSGRTARAGAGGHVVSMILHGQAKASRRLQRELGLASELSEPTTAAFHDDGGDTLGRSSQRGGTASHPAHEQRSRKGSRNAAGGSRDTKRHTGGKATKKRSSGGKASARKGKAPSRSTARGAQSGNQGRGGGQRTGGGGSTRKGAPRRNSSGASRKRRSR